MLSYIADFETTTNPTDCRVWAYGMCEVGKPESFVYGTSINEFMEVCEKSLGNVKIFLHNLKFDGHFIIDFLLKSGFKHITNSKDRDSKTFSTLINDKGFFYSIEVVFMLRGKKVNKVVFWDSSKLFPMGVEKVAEAFKMPYKKLKIDYSAHDNLPIGSPLTEEELEYLKHDVFIISHAIDFFQSQGFNKMTIGSNALSDYKKSIGKNKFDVLFPPLKLKYYEEMRQCYKGGFTYLVPEFEGKTINCGIVLDVNSLYPYCQKEYTLPFGTPIFFYGDYKPDKNYPLYIIMFECQFELKQGKLPTVQIKHSMFYQGNEYLTSSDDRIVPMCMTSTDFELFKEHYEIYNLTVFSGWKFKGKKGLFDEYIDKWNQNKIKAKEEGNPGLYTISKQFLNSLYGKFGTSVLFQSKIPVLKNNGMIQYKLGEFEEGSGVYIPMAAFITSYARAKTIKSAQNIVDDYNSGKSDIQFVYADTDSLHCISPNFEMPSGLDIHDTELGAFKLETKFKRAKYLRQKCYIQDSTTDFISENPEYKLKVVISGLPEECSEQVTFKNFKYGATYTSKKHPEIVPGGIVLKNIDFTILP